MIIRVFAILGWVFFAVGLIITIGLGILASYLFNTPGNDFYQFHLVLIFPGIGMIFLILGVVFLLAAKRKRKLRQWLLENGTPVWAKVQGTEANWSVQINARPATVLVATHKNMRFISDPVSNRELAHVGEHVKVLIHPDNFDKYVFDFANESPLRPSEPPEKI
jgi:hypothetical protein